MKKKDTVFVLLSFLTWRVFLLFVVFLAISTLTLHKDFLGGGLVNYLKNPFFWSWLNFDGEHYVTIARVGYQPLTYFFFPFYPLVTRFFASLLGGGLTNIATSGLLVSNTSLLVALLGLWKLITLDYKEGIAKTTTILLILFPTSFYFGAFYTEGLVLALIIWCFYSTRKGNWVLAGVLGAMATATRITAIALIPGILYEVWRYKKENPQKSLILPILSLIFIPAGLVIYMYYLYRVTGDPLEFFNNISIFGQQRSADIVILPQVFYRYIFKVLPNLTYSYFPVVFTTYLEIITAFVFLVLGILSFLKLRLSYALFFAVGYLIPPLSGSFSSFPRYILILFPAFLLSALLLEGRSRLAKVAVYFILLVSLIVSCALFTRGYWVS